MATEQSVMAVIRASRPSFRNPVDRVVFAIHASFLSAGYLLNATGPPAFADDALSTSSSDEVGIDHWNDLEDNYAFVYSKPENGSRKVLVRCLTMNEKLLVDGLKEGDSETVHLEINVGDYVGEDGGTNYSTQFKNLGKLVADVDKEILAKLDGSSRAAGSSTQPSSSGIRERRDIDQPDVGVMDPDDQPIYRSPGFLVPPVPPFGFSDLFPGPGAGIYPTRGNFGDGSMLVGPNDPRFFGGRDPSFPGGRQGIPPGARFDPYGPPGVPGFEPDRFIGDPPRPRGGTRPDTHPDLEHFGSGSDFI